MVVRARFLRFQRSCDRALRMKIPLGRSHHVAARHALAVKLHAVHQHAARHLDPCKTVTVVESHAAALQVLRFTSLNGKLRHLGNARAHLQPRRSVHRRSLFGKPRPAARLGADAAPARRLARGLACLQLLRKQGQLVFTVVHAQCGRAADFPIRRLTHLAHQARQPALGFLAPQNQPLMRIALPATDPRPGRHAQPTVLDPRQQRRHALDPFIERATGKHRRFAQTLHRLQLAARAFCARHQTPRPIECHAAQMLAQRLRVQTRQRRILRLLAFAARRIAGPLRADAMRLRAIAEHAGQQHRQLRRLAAGRERVHPRGSAAAQVVGHRHAGAHRQLTSQSH